MTVGVVSASKPIGKESNMSTSKIVNLTPHTLCLASATVAGELIEIEPSGTIARVDTIRELVGTLDSPGGKINIYRTEYGDVVGLPEPEDGVIYVVSGLVKSCVPDQDDVYAPADLIRNEDGRVVGAAGLTQ